MRISIDPTKKRRRGSLSIELLLILPILMALLFGMCRFSLEFFARQRLHTACRNGARIAALGGDRLDVERAVRRSLGGGPMTETEVIAELEGDDGRPLSAGEPVVVQVRLATIRVVPDLLRFVGLSHRGETMLARVVMCKE